MLRSSTFSVASLSDKVKLLSAIFSMKQIYVDEYNVDVDGDKDEDGDDGGVIKMTARKPWTDA